MCVSETRCQPHRARCRITKQIETVEAPALAPWQAAELRLELVRGRYILRCVLGTDLASHENDNVGIPELSSPFCSDFFC
jgi:hypothetical protein